MKFVSVRDLRLAPGKVWELAKEEKRIVLTANSRPVAILTGVDENSLEEELDAIERAQALIALDRIHQDSVNRGTDRISEREIQLEIDSVRVGQMS
jgi:antitoxin (DNA-binding transcriptional repressor) of toxin-antitoxin stability system